VFEASKVYVKKDFSIKPTFNEIATKNFNSEAQSLDFSESSESAATINQWVEDNTNNKIKNLVTPDELTNDVRMILINAVYFKALWKYEFAQTETRKAPFYLNDVDSVEANFMYGKSKFKVGEVSGFDATVLELPYKETDITMLIILPNNRTGLAALESKLSDFNANSIQWRREEEIQIYIPKFKIEFDIKLKKPLKEVSASVARRAR